MRFSKEDKISMYHMYQKRYGYSETKEYYPIEKGNFYYLVRILNRYGIAWLNRPHRKWTREEKLNAIMRVLTNHEANIEVSMDLGLSSTGMLSNWIRDYRKNGYNVINRPIGKPRKKTITKHNQKKINIMENFFSVMKREMFYGYENLYKSASDLIQTIHQYIHYYNNDRIKVKLKGLSPVQYRTQSLVA